MMSPSITGSQSRSSETMRPVRVPRSLRMPRAAGVPHSFVTELEALLRASGIAKPSTILPTCSADQRTETDRPARVGRVVTFIDDNLDAPLTLDRLAEEAELSKFHFARVFRDEVGESPWAYVRRSRVERAKSLLEEGATPAAAALDTGFADQSHLTKAMKAVTGNTPGQIRRATRSATDRDASDGRPGRRSAP